MKIEIKHRDSAAVLYADDGDSLLAVLEKAVRGNAYLRGANLDGANLLGANLNWQSHQLISEILFRSAGDNIQRRMLAGLVRISTDWCWKKFLELDAPERDWALQTLAACIAKGDDHPPQLDEYRVSAACAIKESAT